MNPEQPDTQIEQPVETQPSENDGLVNSSDEGLSFWDKVNNLETDEVDSPTESDSPIEQEAVETQQQAEQDDPPTEPEADAKIEAKEDPKRFEYWQSKHDRLKADYEKLKEQAGEAAEVDKDALDLAKLIRQQPKVLDVVDKVLKGEKIDDQAAAQAPEKPNLPQRPSNYNRYDALNDPESESAKYQDALDDYHYKKAIYDEWREGEMVKQQKQQQQRQAQQEQIRRQEQVLIQQLRYEHDMDEKEVQAFIKFASAPQPSLEDLVALYRIKSGKGITQQSQGSNTTVKKKQSLRQNNPPPPNGSVTPKIESVSFWGD